MQADDSSVSSRDREPPRVSDPLTHVGDGAQHKTRARERLDLEALARGARGEIALRRIRDRLLGHGELFGDPAWEICLDLFVAGMEGKSISATSVELASLASAAARFRCIEALTAAGLIVKSSRESDGRMTLVALSDFAFDAIAVYLRDQLLLRQI